MKHYFNLTYETVNIRGIAEEDESGEFEIKTQSVAVLASEGVKRRDRSPATQAILAYYRLPGADVRYWH
jgi:hypothetical protein